MDVPYHGYGSCSSPFIYTSSVERSVLSEDEGCVRVEEPKVDNQIDEHLARRQLASIHNSSNLYGADVRRWPAEDRADLAPSTNITLRIRTPAGSGTHNISLLKLPFIAVSPNAREHFEKRLTQTRWNIPSPSGNLTTPAVRAIAKWLKNICIDSEVREISIPNTSQSWKRALELRMTAIELGMGQYVEHIGVAYTKTLATRHVYTEEALVVTRTARAADKLVAGGHEALEDEVLTAVANRLSYLARYEELSFENEETILTMLSGEDWAPLLRAVQEDGVKALRREAFGLV
ncbi:hypothetical protein EJ07DRAFT_154843 [Lizonia empirigonia]|nr:hypothetical protein EJ07DRAFT_154843 [Lizonia empirigonia]